MPPMPPMPRVILWTGPSRSRRHVPWAEEAKGIFGIAVIILFGMKPHATPTRQPLSFEGVHDFLSPLFGGDLHAKRVNSLAGATLGVIQSASLAVGMIGQGLALARGRLPKHAVKQVDRMLSNPGIDVNALLVALGALSWWANVTASPWPWTGPSSTRMIRQRSCCRCCRTMDGRPR